jgi:hypothetical protein
MPNWDMRESHLALQKDLVKEKGELCLPISEGVTKYSSKVLPVLTVAIEYVKGAISAASGCIA